MCRPTKDIMEQDLIIQEIDDHIAENSLEPLEKLTLRVLKHNYAKSIQIQEDIEECMESPSFLYFFRKKPLQTLTTFVLLFGGFYFFFRVIEILTGLEGVLKLLTP